MANKVSYKVSYTHTLQQQTICHTAITLPNSPRKNLLHSSFLSHDQATQERLQNQVHEPFGPELPNAPTCICAHPQTPRQNPDPQYTELSGHFSLNPPGYSQQTTCQYKHCLASKHHSICSQGE